MKTCRCRQSDEFDKYKEKGGGKKENVKKDLENIRYRTTRLECADHENVTFIVYI